MPGFIQGVLPDFGPFPAEICGVEVVKLLFEPYPHRLHDGLGISRSDEYRQVSSKEIRECSGQVDNVGNLLSPEPAGAGNRSSQSTGGSGRQLRALENGNLETIGVVFGKPRDLLPGLTPALRVLERSPGPVDYESSIFLSGRRVNLRTGPQPLPQKTQIFKETLHLVQIQPPAERRVDRNDHRILPGQGRNVMARQMPDHVRPLHLAEPAGDKQLRFKIRVEKQQPDDLRGIRD